MGNERQGIETGPTKIYCAYCSFETPVESLQIMQDHLLVCELHPLTTIIKDLKQKHAVELTLVRDMRDRLYDRFLEVASVLYYPELTISDKELVEDYRRQKQQENQAKDQDHG